MPWESPSSSCPPTHPCAARWRPCWLLWTEACRPVPAGIDDRCREVDVKEALLYEKLSDERVRCALCSHRCLIAPGQKGICLVRENQGGSLHTLVYGLPLSQAVDPIEKKPLFHFYPG